MFFFLTASFFLGKNVAQAFRANQGVVAGPASQSLSQDGSIEIMGMFTPPFSTHAGFCNRPQHVLSMMDM